jgi:RNA polymerase sigma factor (sigma-70 family)
MPAVERPQLGEEQRRWLAELHARQFERMVRMAARALPPPSRANAEDVVQTVFAEAVTAAMNRPLVRLGEGWLIERLRSRISDHHRRDGRQQRLLESAATVAPAPSAEEVAIDRAAVHDLVAAIPDADDRRTLRLKLSGYTEAEIAARLGLSYEGRQVRDGMRRIRTRMGARRDADRQPVPDLKKADAGLRRPRPGDPDHGPPAPRRT